MEEYYSNLPSEIKDKNYDFIFSHVEDETNHFTESYCDLSVLKGKRIFGHIHIPNKNYLGSALITRYDEHSKDSFLGIIDIETKKYNQELIPKFLDYYEIEYPKPLYMVNAKYQIWDIFGALDKDSALKIFSSK